MKEHDRVGAFMIQGNEVSWRPAFDVTRIVLGVPGRRHRRHVHDPRAREGQTEEGERTKAVRIEDIVTFSPAHGG